ncbi:MAG: M1 family peptidase, partial [Bacteroidota bacterium]
MRLTTLLFCLFLLCAAMYGQQPYFQQQTNYTIEAVLDDSTHQLQADWRMEYTNNSPDALAFIYLHLWPNAYQNNSTAFAKQMLKSGDDSFYFADEKDFGFIDELEFTADGVPIDAAKTEWGPDVVKLILREPLASGETVLLHTPFRMQFPASFSRLGHVGQSYQATQWYPKPAVYDRDGWHPMPYLNYGEYYSEFGNFDVYLTLPDNYLVGASGELKTEAERAKLLAQAERDAQREWSSEDESVYQQPDFPASSKATKTLHYRAENVHDFAWFADKRFYVLHDTIQLASQTVDAWSFFTEREAHLWQESLTYIKRSTHFYSDLVGEYPYPQVTALQSALSAGGGMEYPMVTVIGISNNARSLDG